MDEIRNFILHLILYNSFVGISSIERVPNVRAESYELWNKSLFLSSVAREAIFMIEDGNQTEDLVKNALKALSDFTCLPFSEDNTRVKDCNNDHICVTVSNTELWTISTSKTTMQETSYGSKSSTGITAAVMGAIGVTGELNRKDRDMHVQIRLENMNIDIIRARGEVSRNFLDQLYQRCPEGDINIPFDYFSISLDNNLEIQENEIPVVVPKDPANMWRLYVRIPNDPILSIFDRYRIIENLCFDEDTKRIQMNRERCDHSDCKYGFLQRKCRCVCLPGFAGSECNRPSTMNTLTDILGIPIPSFPALISTSIAWIQGGFETRSTVTPSWHQYLWSCQIEAAERSRLYISLFFAHLATFLYKHPDVLETLEFQMLYTYRSEVQYRSIQLNDDFPLVVLTPRPRKVTLLLLVRGTLDSPDRLTRLASLLTGSPIVTRQEPNPPFHLKIAISPGADGVPLASLQNLSQLPLGPLKDEPEGHTADDDSKGGIRSYLPIVLGVICGAWFILLATVIFCYVRSDRRRRQPTGAESSTEPTPTPILVSRPPDGSSSSSVVSTTTMASTAITSAPATNEHSEDSSASATATSAGRTATEVSTAPSVDTEEDERLPPQVKFLEPSGAVHRTDIA